MPLVEFMVLLDTPMVPFRAVLGAMVVTFRVMLGDDKVVLGGMAVLGGMVVVLGDMAVPFIISLLVLFIVTFGDIGVSMVVLLVTGLGIAVLFVVPLLVLLSRVLLRLKPALGIAAARMGVPATAVFGLTQLKKTWKYFEMVVPSSCGQGSLQTHQQKQQGSQRY